MNNGLHLNLETLNIKNFATFEDQQVNFCRGFNAIVGETGSGKSLILDALQLILGHRADKKLIRKGCDFAIVEAHFISNNEVILEFLNQEGFPSDDDEIIIKRVLYKTGKTKSFLNHQSCSLNTLTSFARKYIDLVGQFENQKLLSEDYQIQLLDNYSSNNSILQEFHNVYHQLNQAKSTLSNANQNQHERAQKIDYLKFQLNEINKLGPSMAREEELISQKKQLQNFEDNKKDIEELNYLFEGGHERPGLINLLSCVDKTLSDRLIDQHTIEMFKNAQETIIDINYKLNSSLDSEFDQEEFENVLSELDLYQKLKRKFGVDTAGLFDLQIDFTSQLTELENIEDTIDQLQESVAKLKNQAFELANHLHLKREKHSSALATQLTNEVRDLNMNGATIKFVLTKKENLNLYGNTDIAFLAETNPGEDFHKIKDIASGGELSRILLALRKVLSAKDSISIFLFDEIDSGIGGETAIKVGNVLGNVATDSQVIAITHLPQIANFADKLIIVSKDILDGNDERRTISLIKEVSGFNLKAEIQQMSAIN